MNSKENNKKAKIKYPDLKEDLINMMKEDQKMIQKANNENGSKESKSKFNKVNKQHRERLKEIIDNIGWPTKDKVGKGGSQAAWLIAQHSDKDIDFQKRCLELLKKNKDKVDKGDLAYLTDRVLSNEDKPQIYGTQLEENKEGNFEPYPIKNIEEVDKRRKEAELSTLSEYLEKVNSK